VRVRVRVRVRGHSVCTCALQDLKRAFTYLDTSNKGHVSVSDIQRALALMGVRMTEEHVRDMVKEVDTSNRGSISFPQFQQLFRNVNGR